MDALPNRRPRPARKGPALAATASCILFTAVAVSITIVRVGAGRGAFDEINYHLPAIRTFTADLWRVHLGDYMSATTPGYHLVLAVLAKLLGGSMAVLRGGNLAFSLALLAMVAWKTGKELTRARTAGNESDAPGSAGLAGPLGSVAKHAFVLMLPAILSMYVVFPGVWLLPDNAGWLGVFAALLLALHVPFTSRTAIAGGIVLLALVLVRQIHLWAAGPLVVAAWMSCADEPRPGTPPAALLRGLFLGRLRDRVVRAAVAGVCVLPAAAAVAWFVRMWGGLVPPTFQGQYHEPNLAAPAFILSVLGAFGVFFAGWMLGTGRSLLRSRWGRGWLAACAGAGLVAAFFGPTTYSVTDGRFSGLWNLVKVCDAKGLVIMGRTSLVMVALSTLGGVVLGVLVAGVGPRRAVVVLAAFAGFAAAQAASFQLWQRYTEPFVLLLLPVLVAMGAALPAAQAATRTTERPSGAVGALRLAGPLVLGVLCAGLTAVSVWRSAPVKFFDLRPGEERTKAFIRGDFEEPPPRTGP
jgi:hypothetical protein